MISPVVTDVGQSNTIVTAATWVQQVMLGSVATVIATIAVAVIGFRMLNGYVSIRHGARVVLGCFILFGAPAIANALKALVVDEVSVSHEPYEASVPVAQPVQQQETEYFDPYAGPTLESVSFMFARIPSA